MIQLIATDVDGTLVDRLDELTFYKKQKSRAQALLVMFIQINLNYADAFSLRASADLLLAAVFL